MPLTICRCMPFENMSITFSVIVDATSKQCQQESATQKKAGQVKRWSLFTPVWRQLGDSVTSSDSLTSSALHIVPHIILSTAIHYIPRLPHNHVLRSAATPRQTPTLLTQGCPRPPPLAGAALSYTR